MHASNPGCGQSRALLHLADWVRSQLYAARASGCTRSHAAAFWAWTSTRRLVGAGADPEQMIAEAERRFAYLLTDEGWATTPDGRLELGLVTVVEHGQKVA